LASAPTDSSPIIIETSDKRSPRSPSLTALSYLSPKERRRLDHGPVSLQVESAAEAVRAAPAGAGIVMIDSGAISDLRRTDTALRRDGLRDRVLLAFGGGVRCTDLEDVTLAGAQIVDMGRAVLNAPLWDLRVEVM
jgi:nicotinate-nucleotide pyrophosphorylase (carboxylating)